MRARTGLGPHNKHFLIYHHPAHSSEHRLHLTQYLLITSKLNDTISLVLAMALYSFSLKREKGIWKTCGHSGPTVHGAQQHRGLWEPPRAAATSLGVTVIAKSQSSRSSEWVMKPKLNEIYTALKWSGQDLSLNHAEHRESKTFSLRMPIHREF